MAADLQIRDANLDDLDAITAVFMECFNAPPWNDGWSVANARECVQAMLETRHFRGAVAMVDGVVVGALLGQKERWVESFNFLIQEMCVLARHQRQGIGRALVNHVSRVLRSEGTDTVYLLTNRDSGAAAFYEALGFKTSQSRIMMVTGLKASGAS
jgi:ribosomal protein S18 acetylase RimI-like enzyme